MEINTIYSQLYTKLTEENKGKPGQKENEITLLMKKSFGQLAKIKENDNIKLSFSKNGEIILKSNSVVAQNFFSFTKVMTELFDIETDALSDDQLENLQIFSRFVNDYYTDKVLTVKEAGDLKDKIESAKKGLENLRKNENNPKNIQIIDRVINELADSKNKIQHNSNLRITSKNDTNKIVPYLIETLYRSEVKLKPVIKDGNLIDFVEYDQIKDEDIDDFKIIFDSLNESDPSFKELFSMLINSKWGSAVAKKPEFEPQIEQKWSQISEVGALKATLSTLMQTDSSTKIDRLDDKLQLLLTNAQNISSSVEIKTALKKNHLTKINVNIGPLNMKAKLVQFEGEKPGDSANQLLILNSFLGTKLGEGAYKKYYLGINIHTGEVGGIGIQKTKPSHDSKKITNEMIEEHELGSKIRNAVGVGIHTTKLITVIHKRNGAKNDSNEKTGLNIDREHIALWAPLAKGTFQNFDVGMENRGNIAILDITPEELYHKLEKLFDLLEKVHKAGYAHNDIKPDNIFIDFDLEPKLADWGLAGAKKEGVEKLSEFELDCNEDKRRLSSHLADILSRLGENNKYPEEEIKKWEDKVISLCSNHGVSLQKLGKIFYQDKKNKYSVPTGYWKATTIKKT
jgi:hypothetical protein